MADPNQSQADESKQEAQPKSASEVMADLLVNFDDNLQPKQDAADDQDDEASENVNADAPLDEAAPIEQADGGAKEQSPQDAQNQPREKLTLKQKEDKKTKRGKKPDDDEDLPPPAYFTGDAKLNWGWLPKEVRRAIITKDNERAQMEGMVRPILEAIGSNAESLKEQYGSLGNGLNTLFKLREFANKSPVEFMNWFAHQAGLISNEDAQKYSQSIAQYQQPIADSQAFVGAIRNVIRNESMVQSLSSEIESMARDYKNYPHFQEFRPVMSQLLKTGLASSLQEAYSQASARANLLRGGAMPAFNATASGPNGGDVEAARRRARSITGAPGTNSTSAMPNLSNKSSAAEVLNSILPENFSLS